MNTFLVIPHMIWFPDPPPSSLLNMFQLAVNFSPKKWCLGLNSTLSAWPAASEVTLLIPLIGCYITSHRVYNWVRGSVADPCSWVARTYTKTSGIFYIYYQISFSSFSTQKIDYLNLNVRFFSFILLNFNFFVPTNLSSL